MEGFQNASGVPVLASMVKGIQSNKEYLGDVDGRIGDGDHGMNMNKGFSLFEKRFSGTSFTFSEGLYELGMILLNEIGGSMGPIYGTVFTEMSHYITDHNLAFIGTTELAEILNAGLEGLYEIVDARVGDKTLVDCLEPATASLKKDAAVGIGLKDALEHMKAAAIAGRDSTKELTARYGRASRLGERSKGVLDAGACSCCIILISIADGILAAP